MSKNNGQWRRSTATGQQRRANGNRSTATVNGNGMAMRDWQQRHDKFFEKKKKQPEKISRTGIVLKKIIASSFHIQEKNFLDTTSKKKLPHCPISTLLSPCSMLASPCFPSHVPVQKFWIHIKKTSTHRNGQDQWAMVTVNGDRWTATGKRRWSMVTVWQWATGSSDTIIVWRKKISSTGIIWKKFWKYTTRKS